MTIQNESISPIVAEVYDLVFADSEETNEQFQAICRILNEYAKTPVKSVLDLCCGTGRMSLPLANKGYQVTALDSSSVMLEVLKEKVGKQPLLSPIQIVHSLVPAQTSPGLFEAVICLDAFYMFAEEGVPEEVMQSVFEMLRPGGVFLFDTYNYFLKNPEGEIRTISEEHNGQQIFVESKPAPLFHDNILQFTNRVEITDKKGDVIVKEMTDTHRHFTPLELKSYLLHAGFSEVFQAPGWGPYLENAAPDDGLLATIAIK